MTVQKQNNSHPELVSGSHKRTERSFNDEIADLVRNDRVKTDCHYEPRSGVVIAKPNKQCATQNMRC